MDYLWWGVAGVIIVFIIWLVAVALRDALRDVAKDEMEKH